jgi:hypothetical protein
MIKNHILHFQLPVTDQQSKNVLPIFVATRNFLFITFCMYEIYKGKYWFHSKNFEKIF